VEYKRFAGAYRLRDFHQICIICTPSQNALAVKISFDLLKGLWSYEGLKLTGSGFPQILVGLGFHPPPGRPKTLSFLSVVCLFVRHALEHQSLCARFRPEGDGVQKPF